MTAEIRNTATIASGTLCSRVFGFVRDLLIAFLLGPGADALIIAFRLPNIFRRLLGEGSLGMPYGAALARIRESEGDFAAGQFGLSVLWRLLLLSILLAGLLAVCSLPLVTLFAPGAEAQTLTRSAELLRLCLPYLPFSITAAIVFTHAADKGQFIPQAWSPLLLNLVIISAGVLALLLQTPHSMTEAMLCAALSLGGAVQLCFGLRLSGLAAAMPAKIPQSRPEVTPLLRSMPTSALGAAPHQLHILAGMILASFLGSGGITALYFAERLMELPLGIAGAAIGIASLPHLASLAAKSDRSVFFEALTDHLRLSAFLSFPATAGLISLAYPIAGLLFGHGANTEESVHLTAAALAGYAAGLPALCATRPLLAACHALNLGSTPVKTALASLIPVVCLPAAFFCLTQEQATSTLSAARWIALSLSVGAWCNMCLLLLAIKKAGQFHPVSFLRAFFQYAVAACALGGALAAAARLLPDSALGLALLIVMAVLVWVGGFFLVRNQDARSVAQVLRRGK